MNTLDVSGRLLAVSPIAVSPPGASFASDDKTSPARLPSAGKERYVPASTLRHVIRYGAALVIQTALRKNGKSLSLDAILALDKGFIEQEKKGSEKKKKPAKAFDAYEQERVIREKNPFLGLLGIWGIPSMLRVRNAIPIANGQGQTHTVASGIVRKSLEPELVEQLSDAEQYLEKLDQWATADKSTTGLKHIDESPWEEILAGIECDWGYQIHRFTPLQSGIVLAALRAFACDPVIGAHKAQGRGEVAMELQASIVEQDILQGPTRSNAGALSLRRGEFSVSGLLADHLAEFDQQMQAGFTGIDFDCLPSMVNDN